MEESKEMVGVLEVATHNKPFKRENLQLAFLASLVILANYKFPLNGALCNYENFRSTFNFNL